MNYENSKRYIVSSKDTPIEWIGFSGGEAFLHFDLLKELISISSSLGKSTSVITNGFWADDYEKVEKRVVELKKAGLTVLGMSYDEFHAKFVPAHNIKNLIRAAKKLDIRATIQAVILNDSNVGDIINKIGADLSCIDIQFVPCSNVGNAAKNINPDRFIRETLPRGLFCGKKGSFPVDYDGTIRPCCNPYIYETELIVGNMCELDVPQSLIKLKNNPFLYLLRNYGFDCFLDIVENNSLDITIPEKLVISCELCSILFSKENYYLLLPFVYDYVKKL